MPQERPSIILSTDAEGLANITEPVVLIFTLSKRDIEACNVASALERLHVLTDTRDAVKRFRDSLAFQVVGYDDDPRELAEIPEVRAFFARITQDWPHWLWFLHRKVGMIPLLMSILCSVTITRKQGRSFTEFLDKQELGSKMMDLFSRGNAMFSTYAITELEAQTSAASAADELVGT